MIRESTFKPSDSSSCLKLIRNIHLNKIIARAANLKSTLCPGYRTWQAIEAWLKSTLEMLCTELYCTVMYCNNKLRVLYCNNVLYCSVL